MSKASSPRGDVVRLMTAVLGSAFSGPTWATWRAVLKAAHALPLTDDERAIVTELSKRSVFPTSPVRELWLLLGRRSGKSIIAALLAVWATCCQTYALAPGEVGTFVVVAADRKQARIIKRYIAGLLRSHGSLEAVIARETAEAIWLTNGLVVEIHTCSWKTLRGYTCIGAAVDEVAFWDSEGSNPDHEVLVALRAAMASVPTAMLIALTSVYARRGEVWRVYSKHFGCDASCDVLVLNGPTHMMNPTIDAATIAAAYEDDPAAAASEFGAEFRKDVESLLSIELVNEAVTPGLDALPPMGHLRYAWFFDGASGSSAGGDAAAHAIAHREADGRVVVDRVECVWPPFDPATVVRRFVATARPYSMREITGDAWAGEWPRAAFEGLGIRYRVAEKPKGELYRELLPLFSSRRIGLPDDPVLTKQLLGLERRTTRSGREIIDHGPYRGAHDDMSNVVAGVAFELRERHLGPTVAAILPASSSRSDWRARYFGRRPRVSDVERLGLVRAPQPTASSDAMRAWREENAAADERARARDREVARQAHESRERLRAEEWEPLVREFGADVVERIQRREDPNFELPKSLKETL
jgi:hypothetical protein